MTSFQTTISAGDRAAGRFIGHVRRKLVRTFTMLKAKRGLKQADLARFIGVHRSVINREFRGARDLTLGRVGALAEAMDCEIEFELVPRVADKSCNIQPAASMTVFNGPTKGLGKPVVLPANGQTYVFTSNSQFTGVSIATEAR